MDQSSEINSSPDMTLIRHQMDETRSALTDKLERLEQKVTDTVQGAVQSVGDTVENVKHVVDDTVQSVRTSVQSVKSSVQDTVHAVGEAFSITHHVERHPWAMVAGATALGFVGGYILMNKSGDARAEEKFRHLAASQGRVPQPEYVPEQHFAPQAPANRSATSSTMSSMRSGQSTNAFAEWLRPAASQVQSLAVGAALSLVRDMLIQAVPKPMTGQVTELVDGLTTSLGGQIIRGNLLEQLPTKPR
jgi:ElaB/YqjD/DUF883 family membrane-anchored ribosome-binding protein